MGYSPYQTAGSQSTLYDLFQQSKFGQQKASSSTQKQKQKLKEEYEAEIKAAQEAALAKQKKHGGFFKGLNILGSFLGPLGAGLTKGISALGQGNQQRKGAKLLLSGVDSDRWDKLFTRNASRAYKEDAESKQMSKGDVFGGAGIAGLTGWGMSKMMGGKKDEGLGKKMFEKPENLESIAPKDNIGIKAPAYGEKLGDTSSVWKDSIGVDSGFDTSIVNAGGRRIQAPDLLSQTAPGAMPQVGQNIQNLGSSMRNIGSSANPAMGGINPDLISNPIGRLVEGKATPFKRLIEELTDFTDLKGQKGFGAAMDKTQQALMLPMLLEQMFGGQY